MVDVSADQWDEFTNDLARLARRAVERTREKMASRQLGEDYRITRRREKMATRIEHTRFSREQLTEIAKFSAKLALVGSYYEGNIIEQTATWGEDGSVVVLTHHEPKKE